MIREIEDVITQYSLSASTPGLTFLVKKSDQTIYKNNIGYRNAARDHISQTSRFRIASITKQFTAAAILQLIERGKLQLDTPIIAVLEDLGPYAEMVTIKHLLTHTSGLPDYEDLATNKENASFTDRDVYEVLCEASSLDFGHGSSYHYSNTGYCLLAIIIEKLSGLSYKDFLEAHIFPRAGMNKASVGPNTDDSRVYGFSRTTTNWVPHDQSKFTSTQGDGGIYASATDLMNWQQSLYKAQNIITAESLELMTRPYVQTNYAGESYGFGIAITTITGELCYLHHGTSSGFENALFYLPKLDISIAVLANFSGTDFNAITLGKRIIANHIMEFKTV